MWRNTDEAHARTHARTHARIRTHEGSRIRRKVAIRRLKKADGRERKGLPSFDLILISASRSIAVLATASDRYLTDTHPPFNPVLRWNLRWLSAHARLFGRAQMRRGAVLAYRRGYVDPCPIIRRPTNWCPLVSRCTYYTRVCLVYDKRTLRFATR